MAADTAEDEKKDLKAPRTRTRCRSPPLPRPATHVHRASRGRTRTRLGRPLPWQRRVHARPCLTVFLWPPAP